LLLSFLVPGLGHIAAGRTFQGLAWLFAFPFAWVAGIWCVLNPAFPTLLPLAGVVIGTVVLWLVMLATAYFAAARAEDRSHNRAGIAGLLSAVAPGLGQMFNGFRFQGALYLLGAVLVACLSGILTTPGPARALYALLSVAATVTAVRAGQRAAWGRTFRTGLFLAAAAGGHIAAQAAWLVTTSCLKTYEVTNEGMSPTLFAPAYKALDTGDFGFRHFMRTGERRIILRSRVTGEVEAERPTRLDGYQLVIHSAVHRVPLGLTVQVGVGDQVLDGQTIASGLRRSGDHVVVNTLAYLGQPPQRGDLVLFSGASVDHPNIDAGDLLIQRVAGLPGERINVNPSYVYVNGKKLTEPKIFDDIANGRKEFIGYKAAHPFAHPPPLMAKDTDAILLAGDEYLLLGDNGDNALDGRYFGPLRRRDILGKVVRSYWPFERAGIPE
jgi:signal peptidase I